MGKESWLKTISLWLVRYVVPVIISIVVTVWYVVLRQIAASKRTDMRTQCLVESYRFLATNAGRLPIDLGNISEYSEDWIKGMQKAMADIRYLGVFHKSKSV